MYYKLSLELIQNRKACSFYYQFLFILCLFRILTNLIFYFIVYVLSCVRNYCFNFDKTQTPVSQEPFHVLSYSWKLFLIYIHNKTINGLKCKNFNQWRVQQLNIILIIQNKWKMWKILLEKSIPAARLYFLQNGILSLKGKINQMIE